PIGLIHPVGDERHPRRSALGDEQAKVRMTVEHAGRHELAGDALAGEGGVDIVEDGTTGAPELDHVEPAGAAANAAAGIGIRADVHREHHPGVSRGGPERVPVLLMERWLAVRWTGRDEDGLETKASCSF